ncbi:MAG: ABC transporter transmembrane domain-containing protein, partial [Candidatus Babeliales bacterium]
MSIEKKICLYTAHVVHKILKEKWFGFLFASSIVVLFLGIVANVSTPILFKNIIDQMEGHNQALMALIISYGCMWIISQASISLREYLMHAIDERSNNLVMKEVLKKLYELPITYHHQKNLGEYLNIFDRIQRNIPLLTWYTLFSIVPVLIELTATMIILLLWYPPHFSIFIALSVISFLTYTLLMTKRALIARDKAIEVNKLTSAQILDWIAQYELVKIFGRTEYVINRLSEVLDKRERTEIKALTLYDAVRAGQAIILGLGLLLVTLSVGSAVQKGTLTVGDFALFNGYLIQFMAPLDLLGYVLLSFRKSILELKDAFSILQEKSLIKDPSIVYQKITTPITIRFDHVSFTYPNNNKLALNDISFTIKQGETVVILGESGSGKSTIVRLLLRLYDPNTGT